MVLSIIPFLLNFPTHRRRMAWLTGLILFAVGGVTPLLMQVGTLPLVVLAAERGGDLLRQHGAGMGVGAAAGQNRVMGGRNENANLLPNLTGQVRPDRPSTQQDDP